MSMTVKRVAICVVLSSLLSACASMRGSGTPSDSKSSSTEPVIAEPPPPGDLADSGSDLKAIPLAVNRQVLKWIDYFQGAGRPHMERYLSRSTRYMPIMKSILREQGLPEDLIYIALIESGFSSTAHSSANAVGYWQFIRGTGKRYGMQIDSYVDERRDFVRATHAAAAYFKDLYGIFHSWYLAIASYNVGEGRVKNLITRYRTRDFWQLARENKLPNETINYVPKYIAARLIAKEPEKYGFTDIDYMPPLEFAEVEFETSMDLRKLAKEMGLEYDDIRDLNPSYKRGVAFYRGKKKLSIRVPKGMETHAMAALPRATPDSTVVYNADEDYSYYRIRRGDTISTIARKFSTSQRVIRDLNNLKHGSRIIAGRRLRVPGENVGGLSKRSVRKPQANTSATVASKKLPPKSRGVAETKNGTRIHVVKRGDTLIDIARRYEVSLVELTRHNNIGRRSVLSIGTRLEIPELSR